MNRQMGAGPQGLEAIMAALATGGAPMGNMAQAQTPMQPPMQGMPMAGAGAFDPLAAEQAGGAINPQMLEMIIQALMSGGMPQAINGAPPVDPMSMMV